MTALAVIEDFDVVEDFGSGLGSAGEIASVDQFQFEGAPEAFHGRVIVAVASAAHGRDEPGGLKRSPEVGCGILDTAIGMEDQAGRGSAVQDGHRESR